MSLLDVIKTFVDKAELAKQFFVWNVAGSVVGAELDPYLTELSNKANSRTPVKPMPPADLADMVVRGVAGQDWATGESAKSGMSKNLFDLLVTNTGEPPALDEMLLLHRRGEATQDDLVRAIKQGRIKNEWIPFVEKMGLLPPSGPEIIEALIKNQVARDVAEKRWAESGSDPTWFQSALDAAGSAPSPDQAATMFRRGIIPEDSAQPDSISYNQAVREGHWRDKWASAFLSLSEYRPPPRTVTALHNSGAITTAQAAKYFAEAGMTPDLIAAYLVDSSSSRTGKYKALQESTVSALFADHAIDETQASTMLENLKYDATEAQLIISVWLNQRAQKAIEQGINTTHTAFVTRKISQDQASTTLDNYGVPSTQRDELINDWLVEQQNKVTLLTAAEIKKAFRDGIIDQQTAMSKLFQHGYSDEDATIYMQI